MTTPGSPDALTEAMLVLEAQRPLLGDAAVDAALAALRQRLAALPPAATEQRRRLVTVLFLDIVGSTALSSTLDPEDIHDVVDAALQAFSAVVVAQGGRVLQYAGDSLLAAFGADVAREDDACRAVSAGLGLLAEAQVQAGRVQQVHGHGGFGVRVGVHTGPVLLGGGVDEEGTIRGFTVNIAARLEQAAPPGSLRISHDTWRHVQGLFDVEAQPPLQVKGQDEPLQTYLVLRARPRAARGPDRGLDGTPTPLVGRDAELAQLLAAFDTTVRTRSLRALTLIAAAGLGKTRLLHELQNRLQAHAQPCWLLLGRCQPSSALQPYGLLRDLLSWRLQIADSDNAETARQRLVDGLAPLLADADGDGQLPAEMLGLLIGMDFSASPRLQPLLGERRLLRDRALASFTQYLRRLSASDGAPVVLVLDDLQWADDASLAWLQQLLQAADLPVLLVMAARPELLEHQPAWGEGVAPRLTLAALASAQRQALTATLLRHLPDPPEALRALIETQAEGNPFYAEELVKMLIDEAVIVADAVPWQVLPDRLQRVHVPGTLTGVLQARLDTLAAADRHALQMASIVGPVFWDDALSALDPAAPLSLPLLQHKAIVQPHADSAFAGAQEQSFHHHLLHQVTYDTVLKAERRAGHAQAARWLAARVGDREAEYLAITAEHYHRAGDWPRAADWFWRAAQAATDRFAFSTARAYQQRLLAMPEGPDAQLLFKVHHGVAYGAAALGHSDVQAQALRDALAVAEQLDDDMLRAMAVVDQALLADRLGDPAAAASLARRAVQLAEGCGAAAQAALAHAELLWLANQRNDLPAAREHLAVGLRWARQAAQVMAARNDDLYQIQLLVVSADMHRLEHDMAQRQQALQQALALAAASRHRRIHASCHQFLALLALDLADADDALRQIDALETLARQVGAAQLLSAVDQLRGEQALLSGDTAAALRHAAAAVAGFTRSDARHPQACCEALLARALQSSGDSDAALHAQQRALQLFEAIQSPGDAQASRCLIAEHHLAAGNLTGAMAVLAPALAADAALAAMASSHASLAGRLAAWRVLHAAGDPRAAQQLAQAAAELDQRCAGIADAAVRARVLAQPLHREICAAAAQPPM